MASLIFWEYKTSTRQWTQYSPRKDETPQGEVGVATPAILKVDQLDTGALKASTTSTNQSSTIQPSVETEQSKTENQPRKSVQHKCRNIAGRCVRQPVKDKLDFISLRQAKKLAKSDTPMYLAFVRGTEDTTV